MQVSCTCVTGIRLWTLEETRNKQALIEVFEMYRELSNVLLYEIFTLDENSRGTRGHSCKLLRPGVLGKYFFSNSHQQMEFAGPADG